VVFRTVGILLRFLNVFLRFFENPKSRDFLRFFAVFRTFSRTMVSQTNNNNNNNNNNNTHVSIPL